MILYLDTSALAKLYVAEEGSVLAQAAVARADLVATCEIAYLEMRSALARRHRERLLPAAEHRRAIDALEGDWPSFFQLTVNMHLLRNAAATAERYRLRAYDALHLAASIAVHEQAKDQVIFASWDHALAKAAQQARLEVLEID